MTNNSIITMREMEARHSAFSVSSQRWIRYRSQDPDDEVYRPFVDAFVKLGGRVLVDEQKFLQIVKSRTGG